MQNHELSNNQIRQKDHLQIIKMGPHEQEDKQTDEVTGERNIQQQIFYGDQQLFTSN